MLTYIGVVTGVTSKHIEHSYVSHRIHGVLFFANIDPTLLPGASSSYPRKWDDDPNKKNDIPGVAKGWFLDVFSP